jgi:hypothetical protein
MSAFDSTLGVTGLSTSDWRAYTNPRFEVGASRRPCSNYARSNGGPRSDIKLNGHVVKIEISPSHDLLTRSHG